MKWFYLKLQLDHFAPNKIFRPKTQVCSWRKLCFVPMPSCNLSNKTSFIIDTQNYRWAFESGTLGPGWAVFQAFFFTFNFFFISFPPASNVYLTQLIFVPRPGNAETCKNANQT